MSNKNLGYSYNAWDSKIKINYTNPSTKILSYTRDRTMKYGKWCIDQVT